MFTVHSCIFRREKCHFDHYAAQQTSFRSHLWKYVEMKNKDKALVKVELIKLGPGGGLLETLLVALPVDVTYAAVACLQAK